MTKRLKYIDRTKLSRMIAQGLSLRACARQLNVSERRVRDELADMGLSAANPPRNGHGSGHGGSTGMPRPLMTEPQIGDRYQGRGYK